MDLNKIFGNLNSEQIKELKDILKNNPESVIEFLQSKLSEENKFVNELLEKKQILQSDEKYKELVQTPELLEKNSIQIVNAEKYLSDFDKVKMELKSLFESSISNSNEKDLTTKLHDRMNSIMVEYLILSGYLINYENNNYNENDDEDIDLDKDILDDDLCMFLLRRTDELQEQYRLLSYLYGKKIGLDDNQIINRDSIFYEYDHNSFFNDILDKGGSVEKNISDFYLNNKNESKFLCTRDENNLLVYPRLSSPVNYGSVVMEFKNIDSTVEKYSPFIGERVEQLYNEILMPYYERTNFSIYNDNKVGTISVIDEYKSKFENFNNFDFYNEYEYDLTQQLVNEFLSQKENKSNKQL